MRKGKTFNQQEKYYEVEDFREYLVSVCYNGNFDSFKKLLKELKKSCRVDFIRYLLTFGDVKFERKLVDVVLDLL